MDRRELESMSPFIRPDSAPIIQPYMGDLDNEYTVGVLSDSSGTVIDSIVVHRKLIGLSLLESKGYGKTVAAISTGISQGYVIRHPEIQEYCEALALRLGSCGR
jgi:carbamoyl-phosphate synthase large subunit